MRAGPENLAKAADYMYEWFQNEGVTGTLEDIKYYLSDATLYNAAEVKEILTKKDADGRTLAEQRALNSMDFFISQGNYEQADREKLLDGDFRPDLINAILP